MLKKHLDDTKKKLSTAKDILSGQVDTESLEILPGLSDNSDIDSDEIDDEESWFNLWILYVILRTFHLMISRVNNSLLIIWCV